MNSLCVASGSKAGEGATQRLEMRLEGVFYKNMLCLMNKKQVNCWLQFKSNVLNMFELYSWMDLMP